MKRLALAAAAAASLAFAAAADARSAGARVNPDPDAVRAYWTPERMRSAKPVENLRGGGPKERAKPGGGGSTSTTSVVSWSAADAMLRTNGKVYFTDDGANYVCSGTAVLSPGHNVVWTAGHCVHDGGAGGAFHDKWSFVPAYNSGTNFGTFVASHVYTTADWANNHTWGRDVGAAVVPTLPDDVGSRPVSNEPRYTTGRRMDAYGYPAAGKYTGQRLYVCDSFLRYVDSDSPDTMGIPCGMTGGSSGGGWVDDEPGSPTIGQLVSVNSYGYSSLKNVMFGPVMDEVTADLLATAAGTSTGAPGSPTAP